MVSKNITPSFSHLHDLLIKGQMASSPQTFMWGGMDWVRTNIDSIVTDGELNYRLHYSTLDSWGGKYDVIVAKCMPTFTFTYNGPVKIYQGTMDCSPSFALDLIQAIHKFSKA